LHSSCVNHDISDTKKFSTALSLDRAFCSEDNKIIEAFDIGYPLFKTQKDADTKQIGAESGRIISSSRNLNKSNSDSPQPSVERLDQIGIKNKRRP
jgi:hypothetical protein